MPHTSSLNQLWELWWLKEHQSGWCSEQLNFYHGQMVSSPWVGAFRWIISEELSMAAPILHGLACIHCQIKLAISNSCQTSRIFFQLFEKLWAVLVEEREQSQFFNCSKVPMHKASKSTQLCGSNRFTNLITCKGKLFIYSCLKSNLSWYIIWHFEKSFSLLYYAKAQSHQMLSTFSLVNAMYVIQVIFIIYCILFCDTWCLQVCLCVYVSSALYICIHTLVCVKVSKERERISVCVCVQTFCVQNGWTSN